MDIYCTSRTTSLATICFSEGTDKTISGQIRGPFCKHARTLPCNFAVNNGQTNLVDPCYWTPQLPFRYEVKLQIEAPNETRHLEFLWGLRRCLPHKEKLRLDGKGTVVRAIAPAIEQIDLVQLRELSCSLFVKEELVESVYDEASELGVMIIDASHDADPDRFLHPAVHFAHHNDSSRSDVISLAKFPEKNGNVMLVEEGDVSKFNYGAWQRPVFVERKVSINELTNPLADMRKTCDWLQRDLAKLGQFAGYMISLEA